MISVRLDNIVKRYADPRGSSAVKAVDGVTLDVGQGELFFLLGPSGCGKTTILRIVAGLLTPDEGRVFFADRDVTDLPTNRRNTGLVFQSYALWPHMTVAKNIAYGLQMRRLPRSEVRARVDEVLSVVRMQECAGRYPGELSGGQQQRVALARALVVRPDVLLLDEPLSNLDAKLRVEMRAEIRRIHAETGITTLYVTHDQKEALVLAQRLAVMHAGRVLQVGGPRDVYDAPANRFVAEFIGETNLFEAEVTSADGDGAVLAAAAGTIRASARQGHEKGARVFCAVRPEAVTVAAGCPEGENVFEAKVVETAFLGDALEVVVSLAAGGRCRALVASRMSFAAQERVWISFASDRVNLFEADAPTPMR